MAPPLHHDGDPQAAAAPNAYEQEREARIAANRARLVELGIVSSTNASAAATSTMPLGVLSHSSSGRPSAWARSMYGAGQKVARRRPTVALKPFRRSEPTRSSSRIRGLEAAGKSVRPGLCDALDEERHYKRRRRANVDNDRRPRSSGLHLAPSSSASSSVPTTFAAPFSLRSIDVTVLSLGRIHRGAWSHRYWSSPGCLYHHAYPVGFRAVKSSALGSGPWECRVEEGEAGPLFVVQEGCEEDGGEEGGGGGCPPRGQRRSFFSGPSPTRPWTDACLARATGQRISGPLFFGFSDPAVQAAVESLYSAEELAAARRGEGGMRRHEGNAGASAGASGGGPSPSAAAAAAAAASASAERAALDFMARYGIGEATACVLAHTTALGGEGGARRFASADELEAWARGGGGGGGGAGGGAGAGAGAGARGGDVDGWPPRARQLLAFLLGSEEFPASTRRWPAWRLRMAPRLVASVCGLGLRKEEEEEEEEEEAGEKEEGKKEGRGGGRREARGGSGVAAKTTTQQRKRATGAAAAAAAAAAASSARSVPVRATRSSRK